MAIGSVPGAGHRAALTQLVTAPSSPNLLASGDDHLIARYAERIRPFSDVLTKQDKRMLGRMYQMAEQAGGKAGAEVDHLAQALATQRWAEKAEAEAKARALGKPVVLRLKRHDDDLDPSRSLWLHEGPPSSPAATSPVVKRPGQLDVQA